MKLTDKAIEDAQRRQNNADSDNEKVLNFPTDKTPYEAFSAPTSDPLLRLKIRANKMFLMPRYDLLYDVAHTGTGDFIGLIYPHMQVKMYGRNLNPIIDKLFTHSVEWVCEYYPLVFELRPSKDAEMLPCIEEIIIEGASIDPREEALSRTNKA